MISPAEENPPSRPPASEPDVTGSLRLVVDDCWMLLLVGLWIGLCPFFEREREEKENNISAIRRLRVEAPTPLSAPSGFLNIESGCTAMRGRRLEITHLKCH